MAAVRSSRPVRASSWSAFGANQSAAASSGARRSKSRGRPGCSTSTATSAPPCLAAFTTAGSPSSTIGPRASGAPMSRARLPRTRSRSTSASSRSGVAPGTWRAGRSPLALIGRIVADVWAPRLRLSPLVSTPCRAIAATTMSPSRSSPSAPMASTLAPSLARSTPVPAAVPAAVARISLQPYAALAGRDRPDRPAEHVQDVRAEHGHGPERPGGGRVTGAAHAPVTAGRRAARRNGGAGPRR